MVDSNVLQGPMVYLEALQDIGADGNLIPAEMARFCTWV